MVCDGESVCNSRFICVEGFVVDIIEKIIAGIDKIAEMHQFCFIDNFQRIRHRVTHIEFDGLVGLSAMGRLCIHHTQFLDFSRTSIICTISVLEDDGIAAVFKSPCHAGITSADGEIRIHAFGQLSIFQLQSRRGGERCRPVGHFVQSPRIEIRIAVGEIVCAQKRLKPISHHLAGSPSFRHTSDICIIYKTAAKIFAADTLDITECRVIVIVRNLVVRIVKLTIRYMIAKDGTHSRFVRIDRIADVIVMNLNIGCLIGIPFILCSTTAENTTHIHSVGLYNSCIITIFNFRFSSITYLT